LLRIFYARVQYHFNNFGMNNLYASQRNFLNDTFEVYGSEKIKTLC
jgi:hypothetical protein